MTEQWHDPNSLADLLDQVLPPGDFNLPDAHHDPLIDSAILVASPAQPEPISAEARSRIRAQMLDAYSQQTQVHSRRLPVQSVLRWAVAASLAIVMLFFGLRPAVLASVPGDILYPAKQTVENVELAFSMTAADRAGTYLTHAERRLQESMVLLDRGQLAPDLMTEALDGILSARNILQVEATLETNTRIQLEARVVQVDALFNFVLVLAEDSEQNLDGQVDALIEMLRATQSGNVVPPTPPIELTPPPSPASFTIPEVTASPELPTASPVPSATPTQATSGATITATVTAEIMDAPSTIVVEGPVQAINDNIIAVFDFEIQVDPADPILINLTVGDTVRIEGNTVVEGGRIIIVAITITLVDPEIIVVPGQAPPASETLPENCRRTPRGRITCRITRRS